MAQLSHVKVTKVTVIYNGEIVRNNYLFRVKGLWFVCYKTNYNYWTVHSTNEKFVATIHTICEVVIGGYKQRGEALRAAKERINTAPHGFFHNI